jgi:hypothetical protein
VFFSTKWIKKLGPIFAITWIPPKWPSPILGLFTPRFHSH